MADDANTVKVKALKYFRGQEGEGTDGNVAPGDELSISRQRAADLFANGLVEHPDGAAKAASGKAEADTAQAGATAVVVDKRAESAPDDKRSADTVGSVTINDKRKPLQR